MYALKLSESDCFIFRIYQYDSWSSGSKYEFLAGFDDDYGTIVIKDNKKVTVSLFASESHYQSFQKLLKLLRTPGVSSLLDDYCEAFRDSCWTPHPAAYTIIFKEINILLINWENSIGLMWNELPDGILAEIIKVIYSLSNNNSAYFIPDRYINEFDKIKYIK